MRAIIVPKILKVNGPELKGRTKEVLDVYQMKASTIHDINQKGREMVPETHTPTFSPLCNQPEKEEELLRLLTRKQTLRAEREQKSQSKDDGWKANFFRDTLPPIRSGDQCLSQQQQQEVERKQRHPQHQQLVPLQQP